MVSRESVRNYSFAQKTSGWAMGTTEENNGLVQHLVIGPRYSGMRLDKVLPELLDGISRARIQKMIEEGVIVCNGRIAEKKQPVVEGDCIDLTAASLLLCPAAPPPKPQDIPVEVLYEDEDLVAVNKPAGLVVHPGHGVPDGTLVNALLYRDGILSDGFSGERPGIVHRLDKDTSGVLLVARNNIAHTRLAASFAERTVKKEYIAVCIGKPSTIDGVIELPLDRNRREPIKRAVTTSGKPAVTSFHLEFFRNGISVIRLFPRTGRTHQIRVHCSASGFPVLADSLYGGSKERILRINPAERPFAFSVFKCFFRHALHARKITFPHPRTHQPVTIEAPFPEDFNMALRLFGADGHFLL